MVVVASGAYATRECAAVVPALAQLKRLAATEIVALPLDDLMSCAVPVVVEDGGTVRLVPYGVLVQWLAYSLCAPVARSLVQFALLLLWTQRAMVVVVVVSLFVPLLSEQEFVQPQVALRAVHALYVYALDASGDARRLSVE